MKGHRPGGLTLAEVLVSTGLMLLLATAIFSIFFASKSVFRRGSGRLEAQARVREVLQRVTPLLLSAVPPGLTEDAIYVPAIGLGSSFVEFYSADDLLDTTAPSDPRNPLPRFYRIRFESAQGDLICEQLYLPTRSPVGQNRVLGRRLYSIEFERRELNLLEMSITARQTERGASGQPTSVDITRQAILAIPYYSSPR